MKKINVLDLFCGAGGLSNGFLQAGYNISCGIDFKYDFVSTFKKNFKNSKAIYEDISKISDREIKKKSISWVFFIILPSICI